VTLDARGHLDLRPGEDLYVRLVTVGSMKSYRGRIERHVGKLRGYHFLLGPYRSIDCSWNNCRYCEHGVERKVKYETLMLWESPDGLRECTAFLTSREHRLFGKAAEIIEKQGRDPRDVRLLWRYKSGTRTPEVLLV
jgi:hypothetical protein